VDPAAPRRRPLVDEKLADQLLGRAQAEGAGLLCPAGCPPADTLWRWVPCSTGTLAA